MTQMTWRDAKGFGLVEQIIALAVLSIATAMAVPALHRMLKRNELHTAQSDYLAALQHARNLAVNEQTSVVFCSTRDARTCSGDDSWSRGWAIGQASLDDKSQLSGRPRYFGRAYGDQLVITSNGSFKYVLFGPDGSAGNTYKTLSFCMKGEPRRVLKVIISSRGRVKGDVTNDSNASPCSAAG